MNRDNYEFSELCLHFINAKTNQKRSKLQEKSKIWYQNSSRIEKSLCIYMYFDILKVKSYKKVKINKIDISTDNN